MINENNKMDDDELLVGLICTRTEINVRLKELCGFAEEEHEESDTHEITDEAWTLFKEQINNHNQFWRDVVNLIDDSLIEILKTNPNPNVK